MFGNSPPTEYKEGWVKHLDSREERRWSRTLDITSREDLIEATLPGSMDDGLSVWRMEVRGSIGFPRVRLGDIVIRRTDGKTTLSLE